MTWTGLRKRCSSDRRVREENFSAVAVTREKNRFEQRKGGEEASPVYTRVLFNKRAENRSVLYGR